MVREKLRTTRINHNLSQRELGLLVGVTENHIRQIENCRRDPSGKVLLRIASTLGLPSEELFEDLLM